MADQTEVLRALGKHEEAVGPKTLADELKMGQDKVRTYLSRLKDKGYADGAASEWTITESGRSFLETGQKIPPSKEDVGVDELSKFKYYGGLAGVEPDLVAAAAAVFENTDMRSMSEFERVMAEMSIPVTNRNRWTSLYRSFLRSTTPLEKREELYPLPKVETPKGDAGTPSSGGERPREDSLDYIVEGNEVHRVGEGLGDFTFTQARQVLAAKRGSGLKGDGEGGIAAILTAFAEALKNMNPNQPVTVQDLINFATTIKTAGGGGGTVNPNPGGYIGEDGEWHELKPGQHVVVIKKEAPASTGGKTLVVKQTERGIVTEEHEAGAPIIINASPPTATQNPMMSMLPYPVFGSDGKPVVDQNGHPVYANLQPMIEWLRFQGEERRANERQQSLMGLVQTVRENVPDGVQAIIRAVEEEKAKRTGTQKEGTSEAPQAYECGQCHAQFTLPTKEGWTQLKCPGCGHIWPKEEVMKV